MRIRALSAVLPCLLLVLAATSSCDLVPVETLTKIFEDEFENFWPNLSPDGKYLAFCSDKDGNEYPYFEYDIYIVEIATGELTQLTVNNTFEYMSIDQFPCWSSDSQWVYFSRLYSDRDVSDQGQLCRVPITGGEENVEILTYNTEIIDMNSEGTMLAVFLVENNHALGLATFDIATGQLSPVPNTEDIWFRSIKFTPDETGIIASMYYNDNKVVTYPLDGSAPVEFNYNFDDIPTRISFAPDGTKCLFHVNSSMMLIPIDGGDVEYINPDIQGGFNDSAYMYDGLVYFVNDYRDEDSIRRYALYNFKP
jgi:hypothetical protein